MMNASQMDQYQKWTAKEAIRTAFSASVLSMQSNILSKPLIRMIPGSGILKERAEIKKRELYEKQGRDETGRKLSKQELEDRQKRRKDLGALGELKDLIVDQWQVTGVPIGELLDTDTKFLFEAMGANLLLVKDSIKDIQENVKALKEKIVDEANDARANQIKNLLNFATSQLPGGGGGQQTEEEMLAGLQPTEEVAANTSEESTVAQELKEANAEKEDHDADVRDDEHDWWLKEFIPDLIKQVKAAGGIGGGGAGGEAKQQGLLGKIRQMLGISEETAAAVEGGTIGAGGAAIGGAALGGGAAATAAKKPSLLARGMGFAGKMVGKASKFVGSAIEGTGGLMNQAWKGGMRLAGRATGAIRRAGGAALEMGGKAAAYAAEKLGITEAVQLIKASAPKVVGWIGKGAGAAIGPVIETALGAYNISQIKADPTLSPKEKKEKIGKAIGSTLGGALGSVSGSVVGALAAGAAAAGTGGAGALAGPWVIAALNAAGGLAGNYIGSALADALGPEAIYDFAAGLPGVGSLISIDETQTPSAPTTTPTPSAPAGVEGGTPSGPGEFAPVTGVEGGTPSGPGEFAPVTGVEGGPQPMGVGNLEGMGRPPTGSEISSISAQNEAMKIVPMSNNQINAPSVSAQTTSNTVIASAPTATRTGADFAPTFSGNLAFG
jgi:hypothetical protein